MLFTKRFLSTKLGFGTPASVLVGSTAGGDAVEVAVNNSGKLQSAPLANERDIGTSNAHGVSVPEWNYTAFNPRAAATGSTKGAAGAVGTTEVLIGAGVPILVGSVIFEEDSAAGSILLRNAASTGQSVVAHSWSATQLNVGLKFGNGLTVCGTAIGVSAVIAWRALGANS